MKFDSMLSPGSRGRLLAALMLPASVGLFAACFDGFGLEGLPCKQDADCGPFLFCVGEPDNMVCDEDPNAMPTTVADEHNGLEHDGLEHDGSEHDRHEHDGANHDRSDDDRPPARHDDGRVRDAHAGMSGVDGAAVEPDQ